MQGEKTLKRHAALVDRMGSTLGLDLEEMALRGEVTTDEIADAVLSCSACSSPGACETWLDAHAGTGSDRTPGYCRNADLFERLRPT